MSDRQYAAGSIRKTLLSIPITVAQASQLGTPLVGLVPMNSLVMQANFVYGSGGTTVDAYVQTSIDGGANWFDIANFHFTTASLLKGSVVGMYPSTPFTANTTLASGALTANTVLNGILGDRLRVLYTTVGTYAGGTSLAIDVVTKW